MAVNGKFSGITRSDLLTVADRFGVGTATEALQRVCQTVEAWPDFARQAGVSGAEIARIRQHQSAL